MTGEPTMTPEPPSSADPDPQDPEAVAEEALTTARDLVGSLDTYSASRDQDLALAALEELKRASEDENLSATDQEKYMDEYEKLKDVVQSIKDTQEERAQQQREREQRERQQPAQQQTGQQQTGQQQTGQQQTGQPQREEGSGGEMLLDSPWIDALDRWDDETGDQGVVSLDLKDGLNVRTPEFDDVVDKAGSGLSTKISAFRDPGGENLGDGVSTEAPTDWIARTFQTDSGQYLKIFTNHGGAETIFSETWQQFGDANSNINYFTSNDYNYYKDAFGDPNVEFDVENNKPQIKVTTTDEGSSSAIHVSDIDVNIGGESITLSSTTPLTWANGSASNIASFGDVTPGTASFSLFGQAVVEAFCGQPNTAGTTCEVTLNPDGHLFIKSASTQGVVTFSMTSTTNALASEQVVLERPDTSYTVMGYWMDEEGDSYNIDTFATARYGPRDSTGLTENIGELAGTATYAGDAVGVYVMNKGDETNLDLHDGEFKATVSLQANFGTSNASSNDNAFTVNGTITSFESVTRSDDDLSAWTLDLNQSSVNNSDGSFSGTTTGEGNWQGQFYGKDNLDTTVTTDDLPLAAVGDFSGDFGNSNRVVGVFSAEKQ